MEGAFVLCQSFHSVVATYVVNEDPPVVAGAGEDFVIVRMNGQPVHGLLVQEDVEGLAPERDVKAKKRLLSNASASARSSARRRGGSALRAQIVDYNLIVVPRGEYLGLAAVVTKAEYIANVLRLHHGGFAHTLYRLLHSP